MDKGPIGDSKEHFQLPMQASYTSTERHERQWLR